MRHILGIETSCDETAAAVITDHPDANERIRSNIILSQTQEHLDYGGVVPEIAARAHLEHLPAIVEKALHDAQINHDHLDAIAVTSGPGLIGGVLVGVSFAKAFALSLGKPCYGINHLEGHALTPRLSHNVPFPYLLVLASGGHCQFIEVLDFRNYRVLGTTIDDAAGEAFDKSATLLNLPYPGGPEIEKLALKGDPKAFDFPRPLLHRDGCNLSFAGLKTAVRNAVQKEINPTEVFKANIAASFQQAVADVLTKKLTIAISLCTHPVTNCVVAGGVAANQFLGSALRSTCAEHNITFTAPPLKLCTDNAAMIGWVGMEMLTRGISADPTFLPRPRWPLAEC